MPQKPHEDPAALLAELRRRVESAAAEITQLTAELARRDGCIDELESALDTVLGLIELPIVVVDDDHRIRALSRGAAQRFGRDAGVGRPLSSVVPDEVLAAIQARRGTPPPDDQGPGGTHALWGSGDAGAADAVATVTPLPGEGAIVVLINGNYGCAGTGTAQGQSPSRRARRDGPPDGRREHGRRDRRSR